MSTVAPSTPLSAIYSQVKEISSRATQLLHWCANPMNRPLTLRIKKSSCPSGIKVDMLKSISTKPCSQLVLCLCYPPSKISMKDKERMTEERKERKRFVLCNCIAAETTPFNLNRLGTSPQEDLSQHTLLHHIHSPLTHNQGYRVTLAQRLTRRVMRQHPSVVRIGVVKFHVLLCQPGNLQCKATQAIHL